jgi:dihydrofolate reductase
MAIHKKEVNIIVAMAENNTIGKDNKLLWHLPNDLTFFKNTTMGCPIIMGRKTYESIGRLLPGRQNIIISRDKHYQVTGAIICDSLGKAIDNAEAEKVFVIGGGQIYKQSLESNFISNIYITKVHTVIDGDTFFPTLNANNWQVTWEEKQETDEKNKLAHTFQKFEKLN